MPLTDFKLCIRLGDNEKKLNMLKQSETTSLKTCAQYITGSDIRIAVNGIQGEKRRHNIS